MSTVRTFIHPDGDRGVEIYQRDDGFFSFREIKLYDIPTVGREWRRDAAGQRGSIYDSARAAEREARAAISWLQDRDAG